MPVSAAATTLLLLLLLLLQLLLPILLLADEVGCEDLANWPATGIVLGICGAGSQINPSLSHLLQVSPGLKPRHFTFDALQAWQTRAGGGMVQG